MHVPGLRCKGSSSIQIANTLLSILVCVFESSAALFTLARSIQALRFGNSTVATKKHTFHYLVTEQGVFYFGLVSIFTIGATVLNFRAPGGFLQRLLNAITLPLSGMLAARFILRIRAYTDRSGHGEKTEEVSTFHASRLDRATSSLVDEFGQDPVHELAAQDSSEDAEGEKGKGKEKAHARQDSEGEASTSGASAPSAV